MSSTKAVRRFWTPRVREMLAERDKAEAQKQALLKDVTRQVFHKFAKSAAAWAAAVSCLAQLDALCSLALVSLYQEGASTRPDFLSLEETQVRSLVGPALVLVWSVLCVSSACVRRVRAP